jgi:hypothetical protein
MVAPRRRNDPKQCNWLDDIIEKRELIGAPIGNCQQRLMRKEKRLKERHRLTRPSMCRRGNYDLEAVAVPNRPPVTAKNLPLCG